MRDVDGEAVEAIAHRYHRVERDSGGRERCEPLDDYYLWCDHRAWRGSGADHRDGARARAWRRSTGAAASYSSEWGLAKLLHWLRHNPDKRERMATALEHCDMVAAVLCGITRSRRRCRAASARWATNGCGIERWADCRPEEFLTSVDPLLAGRARQARRAVLRPAITIAGILSPEWAAKLGLRAGIPIPVGAFDAHWDAIGAGCRIGDVVNVVGTSTCIMAIARQPALIPGVCGVVPGSIHPRRPASKRDFRRRAIFSMPSRRRAGTTVAELVAGTRGLSRGADGSAAPDLGQRRPDGAGESGAGRRHARAGI